MNMTRMTYDPKGAAIRTGFALSTVYRALEEGILKGRKTNSNRWVILEADLDAWMKLDRRIPYVPMPQVKREKLSRSRLLEHINNKQKQKHLSREGLAQEVGLRRDSLQRALCLLKKGRLPSGDTLFALLLWLNIPLSSLATEEDPA